MHGSGTRRALAPIGAALAAGTLAATLAATAAPATGLGAAPAGRDGAAATFDLIDLVSDQPGRAAITDPHLVNAWGMSHGPNTPLWVSNNGTDSTALYTAGAGGAGVAPTGLVVELPGGADRADLQRHTRLRGARDGAARTVHLRQ
jgi:hypothetical protein